MRILILGILALTSVACPKEEPRVAPADAAVKTAEPPLATPADAAAEPVRLVGGGKMEHCPTTVEGATVKISDTPEAVEITVTATDPRAVTEIRADARHVRDVSRKAPSSVRHTGEGEGGGGLGKCPVVLKDTEVTVAEVEGGSKITVKPKKPADLEALKKEVQDRHTKAPAAKLAPSVVGTVGGGRMAHCPTTIPGATVTITDAKDAVEVTIASKDAAAAKEIRADAKHLAEVSKKEPTNPRHTGEGEGGGGLGKCPIVLKETSITAANAEGGSRITIKPRDPKQLDWLKREVRARHGGGAK